MSRRPEESDGVPGLAAPPGRRCWSCGYDLAAIGARAGAGGPAVCPECGAPTHRVVPTRPRAIRCTRCTADLTGRPIHEGFVRCPSCERRLFWSDRTGRIRRTTGLSLALVLVLGAIALFTLATVVITLLLLVRVPPRP